MYYVINRCLEPINARSYLGPFPRYPQALRAWAFRGQVVLAALGTDAMRSEVSTAGRLYYLLPRDPSPGPTGVPELARGPLRCRHTAEAQAGEGFLLTSQLLPDPVLSGT
ncbi:hypothetical protein [Actinoalloteichus caeruleus]|uniref:Uncharacterized protein n=2 Tax=Actinoalloteichus caeruleus DSM 43889 TaxID=1120930 RepID=A0ABT1JKS2_ACTCY|nr:hypothetical protein [Actinoalloteichus caeruleus]MCP2333113.1 hypothetical protein [Actinoalloteichus caeruleus DSM 43889]